MSLRKDNNETTFQNSNYTDLYFILYFHIFSLRNIQSKNADTHICEIIIITNENKIEVPGTKSKFVSFQIPFNLL